MRQKQTVYSAQKFQLQVTLKRMHRGTNTINWILILVLREIRTCHYATLIDLGYLFPHNLSI